MTNSSKANFAPQMVWKKVEMLYLSLSSVLAQLKYMLLKDD